MYTHAIAFNGLAIQARLFYRLVGRVAALRPHTESAVETGPKGGCEMLRERYIVVSMLKPAMMMYTSRASSRAMMA